MDKIAFIAVLLSQCVLCSSILDNRDQLRRITSRIDVLENRVIAETRTLRDDIALIFVNLLTFEDRINATLVKLQKHENGQYLEYANTNYSVSLDSFRANVLNRVRNLEFDTEKHREERENQSIALGALITVVEENSKIMKQFMRSQNSDILTVFETMNRKLDELTKITTTIGSDNQVLKTVVTSVQNTLSELNKDFSGHQTSLTKLETDIPELEHSISEVQMNLSDVKVSISNLQNGFSKQVQEILDLMSPLEFLLNSTRANVEQTKNLEAGVNVAFDSVRDLLKEHIDDYNDWKSNVTIKTCLEEDRKEDDILAKSCSDLKNSGQSKNGVYKIAITQEDKVDVYCDMTTDGGGWTVFQRRQDGSVDFYRGWEEYKRGFGDVNGEFWLGNDVLHELSVKGDQQLRVDLWDWDGNHRYALYSSFAVASAGNKYKITVGGYSGDAEDSISTHSGMFFSTKDRDNDIYVSNCAALYKSGWWYHNCHRSNLNGLYLKGKHSSYANGVNWYGWHGHNYSLKRTEMKIRPQK